MHIKLNCYSRRGGSEHYKGSLEIGQLKAKKAKGNIDVWR